MGNALHTITPTEIETCIFVLGSRDPEMDRIAQILAGMELPHAFAMTNDSSRVNPRDAYTTNHPISLGSLVPIFVECAPASAQPPLLILDHHRPGDPGYDKTSTEFAQAASIGQLCTVLGIAMSQDDRTLAAMDHCFGSAVSGQCPGVSRQDVLGLKIDTIANSHNVSRELVTQKIQTFIDVIHDAQETEVGPTISKDLRSLSLGPGNSLEHLVVVTAQAISGLPLLLMEDDYLGNRKTTFRSPDPHDIEFFMNSWAPIHGCSDIYGVPNRGYAGAYETS